VINTNSPADVSDVEKGEGGFFIPLNCFACTFQPILALLEKKRAQGCFKVFTFKYYYAFYFTYFLLQHLRPRSSILKFSKTEKNI
jgi:hypothetical protein